MNIYFKDLEEEEKMKVGRQQRYLNSRGKKYFVGLSFYIVS